MTDDQIKRGVEDARRCLAGARYAGMSSFTAGLIVALADRPLVVPDDAAMRRAVREALINTKARYAHYDLGEIAVKAVKIEIERRRAG